MKHIQMSNTISNTLINGECSNRVLSFQSVELAQRIPFKLLQKIRTYHMNVDDTDTYEALNHIGIDAMADMISQGCFLYDIAMSIGIPVNSLHKWLDQDPLRTDAIVRAEEYSAESYLSTASQLVMGVKHNDPDGAKIAKMKAEHMRWLASRKDSKKYGDKVNVSHKQEDPVEIRININNQSVSPDQQTVIDY